MTGRAAGFCAGYNAPGYANPVGGRGFGGGFGGRGGGRGRRNRYYATGLTGWQRAAMGWPGFGPAPAAVQATGHTPQQELDALQAQAENLQQALDDIRSRIEDIKNEDSEG
jgi:hypothetical protein